MMISERLNIFFRKVEKGLSGVKTDDIAKFAAKEAVGAIPVVGQIIKDALDEFSPDEKEELIKEMKELSEIQFKEISENIGVSIEYLEGIQKFTLYTFKELRADHNEIKKLLFHLIETAERSVPKILVDGDFKAGDVSGQIIVGENNTHTRIVLSFIPTVRPYMVSHGSTPKASDPPLIQPIYSAGGRN